MTRLEAHQFRKAQRVDEDGDGFRLMVALADHMETVNAIYDDIESRVCKNCKYYYETESLCNKMPEDDSWILDYMDRTVPNAQFCPDDDFGCNRFERV